MHLPVSIINLPPSGEVASHSDDGEGSSPPKITPYKQGLLRKQQPLFVYKIDQLSWDGSAFGVTLARDNAVLPACACFTRLLHAVSVPP